MHIAFLDAHEPGLVHALETLGHKVDVWEKTPRGRADILVSSRWLAQVPARAWLTWMRDPPAEGGHVPRYDHVIAPSRFLATYLREHGVPSVFVLRDGIDLAAIPGALRDPYRVLWTEPPARGLFTLLDCWPQVLEQVPKAQLHVVARFEDWKPVDDVHAYVKEQLRERLQAHTHYDQRLMPAHFAAAGVWAYPTSYPEVSCSGAMYAQAAGCRIVSSAIGSIEEVVGRRGILVPGDVLRQATRQGLVRALVHQLTKPEGDRDAVMEHARTHFGWDAIAPEWIACFESLLVGQDTQPRL